MGLVIGAFQPATNIGIEGNMYWMPVSNTVTASMVRQLLLPGSVGIIDELSCANLYQGDGYIVGGFSHNLRNTKRLGVVIQGILPPTNQIVNAAGSGTKVGFRTTSTGLTGNMIPYISVYDELTDERSPLSSAGPTVVFTNQAALWDNLPTFIPEEDYKIAGSTTANAATTITGVNTKFLTQVRIGDQIALSSAPTTLSKVLTVANDTSLTVATALGNGTTQRIVVRRLPRWTHIELWRSVDGSLPRLVGRFPRGVTSVTESVAVGDLGESFVEDFSRFPRCKFAVIWRDRQVMAGFEEDSSRLFLSLIGLPERQSTLELRTLNGEPIVGMFVVSDMLIVQCPQSSYRVQGYTDEDISLKMAQPNLGSVGHFSNAHIHGNEWVWTHLGPYLCDGTSWIPMNLRIKRTAAEDYKNRPDAYEQAWAVHDPVRQVYKLYVGLHGTTNSAGRTNKYTYYVGDYTSVLPQEGGVLGQPRWSFDVRARDDHFAFLAALPGGKRKDVWTGGCNGNLYIENIAPTVADDANNIEWLIAHGADFYSDHGGDFAHGKTFRNIDVFAQNELVGFNLRLYPGEEFAYPVFAGMPIPFDFSVTAASSSPYEPRGVISAKLVQVTGRALTVALYSTNTGDLRYRGYQVSWLPGPAPRRIVDFVK